MLCCGQCEVCEVRAGFEQKHDGSTCEVEYFLEWVCVVGDNRA